ncbi:hypothetical protein BGW36DRAFT_339526 [Talaromyces proteolyticus]|uniref:NmrA-like domain-containing protein n=1 Tax=Talaromyces proteolyticus TaxID=1131652 RepID=A0AAD4KU25_9EURO|nr:uncharacterized protein BGW36DRAFT_339526 [Talaromyces proteolyticus]KAH8698439.1 hypothetical protein BGW36DRAFT_339526 [Talaromyces proteolyticus]
MSDPSNRPEILVIGGTGAQGIPVVEALGKSGRYTVRLFTRDPKSTRARTLAMLPNVKIHQGNVTSQEDLHAAFRGVYGAWVNTDGFTLGEKNELFYAIRAYEIALHEGVKHYVWANSDYALRKAGWNERYHWGHNDAKGRVGDFILAQGQQRIKSTLFTTGPYMEMLFDGMFKPEEREDGTIVWANPAGNGKIPLIALDDVGSYVLWIFDNVERSAGVDLEVTTDQVSFQDILEVFIRVTGKKAVHITLSMEEYMDKVEPYPNAPANFIGGKNRIDDESNMTWRQNFTAWWRYWSEGIGATRDFALLDEIFPGRIKSLETWMRKVDYQGKPKQVLKNLEDLKAQLADTGQEIHGPHNSG